MADSSLGEFRDQRYSVDPAERVRELLFRETIPDTAELTYSFFHGYERLDYKESEGSGALHYAGAYHPDEGYCVGPGVCRFCGRTMFDD